MLALRDADGVAYTERGSAADCRFKLGCCEGDPQTPCDVPEPRQAPPSASTART